MYERAFVQQVLGASVSENWRFCGLCSYLQLFRKTRSGKRKWLLQRLQLRSVYHNRKCHGGDCVANTHVNRRQSFTFNCRWTRQFAVDDGLFCLKVLMGNGKRLWYGCLVFIVPITVHGWGDFSEAVFQAVDADSPQSQWFLAWIFGSLLISLVPRLFYSS